MKTVYLFLSAQEAEETIFKSPVDFIIINYIIICAQRSMIEKRKGTGVPTLADLLQSPKLSTLASALALTGQNRQPKKYVVSSR